MELTRSVYQSTSQLPKQEKYGLISQMQRAAVSIPSNIAEGQQRHYRKEFVQFLYHALGSLAELETQALLSIDIYNINFDNNYFETIHILGKKIRTLIKRLSP